DDQSSRSTKGLTCACGCSSSRGAWNPIPNSGIHGSARRTTISAGASPAPTTRPPKGSVFADPNHVRDCMHPGAAGLLLTSSGLRDVLQQAVVGWVPWITQGSLPWTPSSAAKNSKLPLAAMSDGSEPSTP